MNTLSRLDETTLLVGWAAGNIALAAIVAVLWLVALATLSWGWFALTALATLASPAPTVLLVLAFHRRDRLA